MPRFYLESNRASLQLQCRSHQQTGEEECLAYLSIVVAIRLIELRPQLGEWMGEGLNDGQRTDQEEIRSRKEHTKM